MNHLMFLRMQLNDDDFHFPCFDSQAFQSPFVLLTFTTRWSLVINKMCLDPLSVVHCSSPNSVHSDVPCVSAYMIASCKTNRPSAVLYIQVCLKDNRFNRSGWF